MVKSSASTQAIALILALIWVIPETSAQAPTRADIINLQNQINGLALLEENDRNDILNLFALFAELAALEELHYESTLSNFNTVFNNLAFLNDAVSAMNTSIAILDLAVLELAEIVETMEVAVAKLLRNNEIWLNNFRVIKNIFQNGLKFRGTINFGTPVGIGNFSPRPRSVRKPLRAIGAAPRLGKPVVPAAPQRRGRPTASARPANRSGTGSGTGSGPGPVATRPIKGSGGAASGVGNSGKPGRQPK